MLVRFAVVLILVSAGLSLAQVPEPPPFREIPPDPALQPSAPPSAGQVTFAGARAFTTDELREGIAEQIRDIQASGLTRARADDTAYYLGVFYRKRGYSAAEVNWNIRGSQLILSIREGPRTFLRRVLFRGNRDITDATLFDYMIGATEERLRENPEQFPFVAADVKTGADRIRGLYETEGYREAVIAEPVVTFSRDRRVADVLVGITEGPRYGFGSVSFVGETLFPREELVTGLGETLDKPYTTQRVNTMERNLQFFFKSRGYFTAEVLAESDPSQAIPTRRAPDGSGFDRLVPVRFVVTPGPLYRFDGATVTGLKQVRPSVVLNRFRRLSGQIYDPAKLDETYRDLLRTGLFSNLRINSVPQPDNTVRIDITAEEAKPKEFSTSVGFSTYEGFTLGLRVADRNFLGYGRPLSFEFERSQRALRAEILYVDPWLFESDYRLRARLYAQDRTEEGYTKRETGARADITRKVTKNIELGTFVQFENVEITETAIEPVYLGATAYQIATLGFTQSYDFRDHPLSPTKGWILNTSLDGNVVAGDVSFIRSTARLSHYWPIGKQMLLAAGVRGGLIFPLTSVPIDERFFVGGGTTVRSFNERELGPKSKGGYPIGGEAFTVFNVELDFPIRGALHGAVFADAGNLIAEFRDVGLDDLRFALGAGLRYKLPIGPVRLDVGINPNPKNDEDWGAVHFSFGFPF